MKRWLVLALLPLFLSSCMVVDLQWEQGNGVAATEVRSLPAFERVNLEGPVHVIIKTGPAYSAYVTADANLTGYFQTDAFAGTLTIGMASGIQPSVEPEITIVMPELRSLTHNGDALVEIQEDGNFPAVNLTLNGGGTIFYSGTASTLTATLNGSGTIEMEGYASFLDARVRGNGELHGENLLTGDADVELSGAGMALLDLDYQSTLNLELTGSGQVEWWGAPAQENRRRQGSGQADSGGNAGNPGWNGRRQVRRHEREPDRAGLRNRIRKRRAEYLRKVGVGGALLPHGPAQPGQIRICGKLPQSRFDQYARLGQPAQMGHEQASQEQVTSTILLLTRCRTATVPSIPTIACG
jgi:Putative auto-transporter adhesin, head GIN domain